MNASYDLKKFVVAKPVPVPIVDSDRDRAELAGTRALVAEECFDALLQMLIDAGLMPKGCAAVMLDRLSAKLLMHASGRTETQWSIRAPELIDQATRLATKSAVLKAVSGSTS